MVTYYNQKDMVGFGMYLFSRGRRAAFEATQSEASGTLEDRIGQVFSSDFYNWKEFIDNKRWHSDGCPIHDLVYPDVGGCTCHREDVHYRPGKK